ncbi:MFS transporter [Flagellatimonas centrodinii]|uniref:AmpG family muropeptide MFS transporter n=1 Tax=Flagellatimonas centrodinii TaxID=2806210 RepID=UPI001FFAC651|nr:MFS transporter [Flagellatimonas centrodinii]ULQ47681.1 MFS transporter [Flagellatimonas centrodinii]
MPTEAAGWRAWLAYLQPRPLAMLFLGFSAGLPFLLVFSTLSAWLREAGIDRTTIGLLSWVGLAYSFKLLWAPVVDRATLPLLSRWLGRRRAWMLLAQLALIAGLAAMAHGDPVNALPLLATLAVAVAFASATQDIVIDAWRIEAAPQSLQGTMAATYQLGYRLGLMMATAGALWLAGTYDWKTAYLAMAAAVGLGLLTTLLIPEPDASAVAAEAAAQAPRRNLRELFRVAIWEPLAEFFTRNGVRSALLILAFVGSFRLTDYTMGVMANPFYLDVGYTLQEIALVAKGYGVVASIIGVVVGGWGVLRLGTIRALVVGGVLVIGSNLAFLTLALQEQPGLLALGMVVSGDNFAYNFAGTAFIAYLSGLTNIAYTATQYALFSSLFSLPGKLLMGASGAVVDAFGYPVFFAYTSLLGLPSLVLVIYLSRRLPVPAQRPS